MASQVAVRKLEAAVRNDPELFHSLVFDTEKALDRLKELLPEVAENARVDPEDVIAGIVFDPSAVGASCGGGETCSCTSGTCSGTCGGSTCSATCSGESCGRTCDDSCGYTTNRIDAIWTLPLAW